jgi:hypothetical protein
MILPLDRSSGNDGMRFPSMAGADCLTAFVSRLALDSQTGYLIGAPHSWQYSGQERGARLVRVWTATAGGGSSAALVPWR